MRKGDDSQSSSNYALFWGLVVLPCWSTLLLHAELSLLTARRELEPLVCKELALCGSTRSADQLWEQEVNQCEGRLYCSFHTIVPLVTGEKSDSSPPMSYPIQCLADPLAVFWVSLHLFETVIRAYGPPPLQKSTWNTPSAFAFRGFVYLPSPPQDLILINSSLELQQPFSF